MCLPSTKTNSGFNRRCYPVTLRSTYQTQLKKIAQAKAKGKEWAEEREDIDDGSVEWTERGMKDFVRGSAAYDRRAKKEKSPHEVLLSAAALERLPSLEQFLELLPEDGTFYPGEVMEACYNMSFPQEAVQLFVDKVFCFR